MTLPVLYTFRRCPYAIRGRMALSQAAIPVEIREVVLRDKPPSMLELSPKGTVPVLQLTNGKVIDESLDVMQWALAQHDPAQWQTANPELTKALIAENDGAFKQALDRYKYHVRFPEYPQSHYRAQGENFLAKLEAQLAQHEGKGLVTDRTSLADAAIFPFIRQFAGVEPDWFANAPYPHLRQWLENLTTSARFKYIMKKRAQWQAGDPMTVENWCVDT